MHSVSSDKIQINKKIGVPCRGVCEYVYAVIACTLVLSPNAGIIENASVSSKCD